MNAGGVEGNDELQNDELQNDELQNDELQNDELQNDAADERRRPLRGRTQIAPRGGRGSAPGGRSRSFGGRTGAGGQSEPGTGTR